MTYQSYPKYKPSDTDWLDQIPDSWEEKRLKYLISQKVTDGPHETPEFIADGVPFLSVDGIQDDRLIFDGCRYISPENHAQYKIKCFPHKGDILLGKAASVGKVAIVDVDFEFNVWSPLALIRANKQVLPKYIYYSFKANTLQDQVFILSTSNTQHNLSMDDIPELWLTFPNNKEQSKIVSFLDRETEKIDEVMEKKQKLIELLLEKRQAIISQAVTKGLNPKAKMKDSGIPWLGSTLERWKVVKIKDLVLHRKGSIKTGPFGSDLTTSDYVYDENVAFAKVYTQENVIAEDFEIGDPFIDRNKYQELETCTLYPGDVVLTTRGTLGKCVIFPQTAKLGVMHPCLLRLQLNNKIILSDFFKLIVHESKYFIDQLLYISNATTLEVLYSDTLKQMVVVLPNVTEQRKILSVIEKDTSKIDSLIDKIKLQNQKLQEFRQALISNVVTGKIKI